MLKKTTWHINDYFSPILLSAITIFFSYWEKNSPTGKTKHLFINPEKPDVPLNKNDAFQKVQKRRVQEKR